jgi:hypothetical protein
MVSATANGFISSPFSFQQDFCCACLRLRRRDKSATIVTCFDTHAALAKTTATIAKKSVSTSSTITTKRIRPTRVGSNLDANMGGEHAAWSSAFGGSAIVHFSSPGVDATLHRISIPTVSQR